MFTKQVTDSKAFQWFEERLEVQALADDISSKYVPPHVNIFYCLGGITLVCFRYPVCHWFCDDVLLPTHCCRSV